MEECSGASVAVAVVVAVGEILGSIEAAQKNLIFFCVRMTSM